MNNRIRFYQWIGGVGTALVVIAISGTLLWQKTLFWEAMAWQALIFSLVFLLTNYRLSENSGAFSQMAIWVFPLLVFLLSWRVPVDLFFIYTIIWAACIPFYLSVRTCWFSLLVVTIAWYFVRHTVWQEASPLTETLLVGTFHVFAVLSALASKESQEANEKTQQLNRELVATQHLLSEASRDSERTRIARNLHDLLGHHLTALTINLQVAGHITQGEAKEKIDQCHALSKLLLNDVRESVSTLRDMPMVNLRDLLEITIRDIPRLQISLDMDDELQVDDVNTAEVLLRLVQEAITNTLKHTKARKATIKVYKQEQEILLDYTDDGSGCDNLKAGNGLTGMRERVERLGGSLHIEPIPSFSLRASAPIVI